MENHVRIARELLRMARMLVSSGYAHKNDYSDADDEERYANELADSVYDHFNGHALESPIVDYEIKFSPKRYLKRNAISDAQNRSYSVRIILMYVNEVDPKDISDSNAKKTFANGIGGEAFCDDVNNLSIVANGASDEEWCSGEEYFHDIVSHELMHVFDHVAYPYAFSRDENYGRRTKHEIRRNLEVPYPVGNADILDQKYAEYYTCENEMREYRSDLRKAIKDYCEYTESSWSDCIHDIQEALKTASSFRKFFDTIEGNRSPFATLYHLCFSKTSHGNRQTAMKMLRSLSEEV